MEAKDIQLRQKDGLLEEQKTELRERATQIERKQRELQTVKVRNDILLSLIQYILKEIIILTHIDCFDVKSFHCLQK